MAMTKMYIAVLDQVGDFMVPTLVAHTVINAHRYFEGDDTYDDWLLNSFKKVVVRVSAKEFDKIASTLHCYAGHENTTLGGMSSCLVVLPVGEVIPNVLKFAKLWAPKL